MVATCDIVAVAETRDDRGGNGSDDTVGAQTNAVMIGIVPASVAPGPGAVPASRGGPNSFGPTRPGPPGAVQEQTPRTAALRKKDPQDCRRIRIVLLSRRVNA